jgi:hypothetical protein
MMPLYDAYQAVPNCQAVLVTCRHPVPSSPVFGHDVVTTFFQKWRSEHHEQAYIEQDYSQAHTSYDGNWVLVGDWWERVGIFVCHQLVSYMVVWDDLSVLHQNQL